MSLRSLIFHLNILSIDIAAGAVIGCAFFVKIFGVQLLPYGYVTLGLAVWIIYTSDHLLDVWRNPNPAATERHRFHQKYFKALAILVIICLLVVAIQVAFIRRPVFLSGLLLSVAVILYLLLQKWLSFLKEFFAAILYTAGVVIAPLSLMERALIMAEIGIIILFFITALINLVLFSWFSMKADQTDNHASLSTVLGGGVTRITLTLLFTFNVMIITLQLGPWSVHVGATLVLAAMNLLLLLIMLWRSYFEIGDRYRVAGDAAFLLPLIYLFIR